MPDGVVSLASVSLSAGVVSPASVSQVGVFVPHQVKQVEGHGEEGRPQEVPEGGQVGDGHVVRVVAQAPDKVDHPMTDVQQNNYLEVIINVLV